MDEILMILEQESQFENMKMSSKYQKMLNEGYTEEEICNICGINSDELFSSSSNSYSSSDDDFSDF